MITGTEYIAYDHVAEKEARQQPFPAGTNPSLLKNYLFKKKEGLALVILLGLISSIAGFLLTVVIGDFFMLQFQTGSSKGKLLLWLGIQLESKEIFFLVFGLLLFVKFLAGFCSKYLSLKHGENFVNDIRLQVFGAQMRSAPEQFNRKSFGKYLLRYSNDMKAVQQYLIQGLLGGIQKVLFVAIGMFLLFKLNWVLAIILTLLFAAVAAVIIILSRWQKRTIRQSRDKRSSLLAFVATNFSRFDLLKKEAKEEKLIGQFKKRSNQLYQTNLANGWMESFIRSASVFFQFAIIGLSLWLMADDQIKVSATDGLMVILLLLMMQGAIRGLLKVPGYLNKGSISLNKINELLFLSK